MKAVFESADGAVLRIAVDVPVGHQMVTLADGRSFAFSHHIDGARCFRQVRPRAVAPPTPLKKKATRRGQ